MSTMKGKEKPPFNPVPVVTLVLYFGDKRWDRYHCLSDVIDVPDRLKPFLNDYRINVFEIAWLSEKQISRFKSDFRVVANFFVKKRLDSEYIPDDLTEITHVDEVLKLISAVSGDNRYYYAVKDTKGKVRNMCEVAERLEKRGIEKGIKKGITQGIEVGRVREYISVRCEDGMPDETIVSNLMKRFNLSAEKAEAAVRNYEVETH